MDLEKTIKSTFGRETIPYRFARWCHYSVTPRILRNRVIVNRKFRKYFKECNIAKLAIGSGGDPNYSSRFLNGKLQNGWLLTDLTPSKMINFMDATKRFPFPDCSFDYVLSEHMIEHISYGQAKFMLQEVFRVMRPGGRIRISTPDLAYFVSLYRGDWSDAERSYIEWSNATFPPSYRNRVSFVINRMFREWGHQFIYDYETMADLLSSIGFIDICKLKVGESDDPELRGVEIHGSVFGNEDYNRMETMVVEASKPIAENDCVAHDHYAAHSR